MSYPWANNLIYRITGSEAPKQGGAGGRGAEPGDAAKATEASFAGIDSAWSRAEAKVADWKSISLRVPTKSNAPLVFSIDSGNGGRPDLRAQLTLKRSNGDLLKWEPFTANNAGRRLRSWIRFSHTGEVGGIPGETIAAMASLGATFLIWTGISLAIRRMCAAVTCRRRASQASEVAMRYHRYPTS